MDTDNQRKKATKVVEAKLGFYIHLAIYIIVNAILVAVNLATDPDQLWFQWPLLGWGAGLLLHAGLVVAQVKGGSFKEWMIAREMKKQARTNPQ